MQAIQLRLQMTRRTWPFSALEIVAAASIGIWSIAWLLDTAGLRPCGLHDRSIECLLGDVIMYATFAIFLISFLICVVAIPSAVARLWRVRDGCRPRTHHPLTAG